ncbi:MAG: threonine/serine dehydratase [Geminicoccaceae bacterium]|nr:threonine/serine dehydratase [Geminicoccaceae bacterium]
MIDIDGAARTLRGIVRRTPLLESPLLNERLGCRLLVKAEPLQITGSFKVRGACNKLATVEEGKPVVAYSSGNHAQGVAYAARLKGVPCTIVMPTDAPRIKQDGTRAYGATVRLYDRRFEDREAIGAAVAAETGAVLVRPYDDPLVIAGQGTVGLEIAEDCAALDIVPDLAFCCCGGGGLIAGVGLALRRSFPDLAVFAVEPEGYDDTARSLEAGRRVEVEGHPATLCDAIVTRSPGEITFPINQEILSGGVAVGDAETKAAMRLAFHHLKLVVEPGGAVAIAAVVAGKVAVKGKTVLAVASGGNVDPELFAQVLAEGGAD